MKAIMFNYQAFFSDSLTIHNWEWFILTLKWIICTELESFFRTCLSDSLKRFDSNEWFVQESDITTAVYSPGRINAHTHYEREKCLHVKIEPEGGKKLTQSPSSHIHVNILQRSRVSFQHFSVYCTVITHQSHETGTMYSKQKHAKSVVRSRVDSLTHR